MLKKEKKESTREDIEIVDIEFGKVVKEFPKSKDFEALLRIAVERNNFGIVEVDDSSENEEVFEIVVIDDAEPIEEENHD